MVPAESPGLELIIAGGGAFGAVVVGELAPVEPPRPAKNNEATRIRIRAATTVDTIMMGFFVLHSHQSILDLGHISVIHM